VNWSSDQSRLRQLLDNLLANAIKFTQRGHVLLEAIRGPQRGGKGFDLELRVNDTGIGISAGVMGKAWSVCEPHRLPVSKIHGGSGLGLPLCCSTAELLGGCVEHAPNAGGGTCFRVLLPSVVNSEALKTSRLKPDLLARTQCLLVLEEPESGVVSGLLRSFGMKVEVSAGPVEAGLPAGADLVICTAAQLDLAAEPGHREGEYRPPVALTRYGHSGHGDSEADQGIRVSPLPSPILRSNLEPFLLRLALQCAITARQISHAQ
jgi:hypothetical protein